MMSTKLTQFGNDGEYLLLSESNRNFLKELDSRWRFSYQEIRILIRIARDLETWDEGLLSDLWKDDHIAEPGRKQDKEKLFRRVREQWENLKESPKDYTGFHPEKIQRKAPGFEALADGRTILGDCPVASQKTRCCNLKTLDAVINCGFDCSYCSIQSFYHDDRILFHKGLKEKLESLQLDPGRSWHIGTGQSSDSLMWGNREGVLETLMDFAAANPKVVLELKTKSDNTGEFLEMPVPSNVLATWSLNTETIIRSEERLTASLDRRLEAARKVADKRIPVGFHFHPMVWYRGWEKDYRKVIRIVMEMFSPEEVVTISFGTLTYIKPVLKQLRKRPIKSKILQMPLEEAAGKWSYPIQIKEDLFKSAYQAFSPWHEKVFFYLCMEDPSLWIPVFGREYKDNEAFEMDMIYNYQRKMQKIAGNEEE